MGTLTKWAAIALGVILATLVLQEWVLVLFGVIVLLWIIRLVADLFWWGRDRDKW